jgi:hypothetical protein
MEKGGTDLILFETCFLLNPCFEAIGNSNAGRVQAGKNKGKSQTHVRSPGAPATRTIPRRH